MYPWSEADVRVDAATEDWPVFTERALALLVAVTRGVVFEQRHAGADAVAVEPAERFTSAGAVARHPERGRFLAEMRARGAFQVDRTIR
jgi:hypothetical protein